MSTSRCLTILLLCLCIGACGQGEQPQPQSATLVEPENKTKTLTLVAAQWPPYIGDANSAPEGYMLDITREIFKSQDIEINFSNRPWSRAIEGAKNGTYDGVIGACPVDGKGLVFPGEAIAIARNAYIKKKDSNWQFNNISSLDEISLGVIQGYDYGPELASYIKEHQQNPDRIQTLSGDQALRQNLEKLMAGRIQAVIDDIAVINTTAMQMGIQDQIAVAGYNDKPLPCYVVFSPAKAESPQYAKMVTEGIQKMRKSGRLMKILAKYGLKDWVSSPDRQAVTP